MAYAQNPNIKTSSKLTKGGEIINPTKQDVANYNAKYKTVHMNPDHRQTVKTSKIAKSVLHHNEPGHFMSSPAMNKGKNAMLQAQNMGEKISSGARNIGRKIMSANKKLYK